METLRSIDLSGLQKGSSVVITSAGPDQDRYVAEFKIEEPGSYPTCTATLTNGRGELTSPTKVTLEGAGSWTTSDQNPVQQTLPGQRAFTIGHGVLYEGGQLTISETDFTPGIGHKRVVLVPAIEKIEVFDPQTV